MARLVLPKMKLILLLLFLFAQCCNGTKAYAQVLNIGEHRRTNLQPGFNSTFFVHSSPSKYSGFTFQLHSQQAVLSLYNGSEGCLSLLECATFGYSVGMVQLLIPNVNSYTFKASVQCSRNDCQSNVTLLVAVIGIGINDPIPGGCAQTSNLENDPGLSTVLAHHSKLLYFQASGIGSLLCDYNESSVIDRLQYHIYRKCLPAYDFSIDTYFDAIEEMLFNGEAGKLQTALTGKDVKRVLFDSTPSAGEVYNIIAIDSSLLTFSAYVPVVSYGCQLGPRSDCMESIPVINAVTGVLFILVGLFLCFLAHRLFHMEVYVFTSLVMCYLFFMLLHAITDWNHTAVLGGSVGCGAVSGILLYSVWFFLGWYYPYVILFGLCFGFIISATVYFSPVGTMVSVLEINYVYAMVLLCGCVVFMALLLVFPRVLNIVSSSLVGSYSVIFGIGVFKRTILTEILLRVVENASVPGLLSSPASCQLELLDIILSSLWGLLFVVGIATQFLLACQHQRAFKKHQCRRDRERGRYIAKFQETYHTFPTSPFQQLKACFKKTSMDTKPLLSPHSERLYGAVSYKNSM